MDRFLYLCSYVLPGVRSLEETSSRMETARLIFIKWRNLQRWCEIRLSTTGRQQTTAV